MRLKVAVSKLLTGACVEFFFALKSRFLPPRAALVLKMEIFNIFLNQWHRFNNNRARRPQGDLKLDGDLASNDGSHGGVGNIFSKTRSFCQIAQGRVCTWAAPHPAV
jgi:hypothetical protein